MKSFGVRFYTASILDPNVPHPVSDVLAAIEAAVSSGNPMPHLPDGTVAYELRDFVSFNNGAAFRGVLAVLRDDAPNIREANGAERPIVLAPDERIIEKNHFLYFKDQELLVWQVNGHGSHVSRFERYLSTVAGHGVSLSDIIQPAALERLNAGTVKRFKVRIASPRNAEAVDPNNWESDAFNLMRGVNGTNITLEISTRKHGKGLANEIKQVAHRLLDRADTRALEVKLDGQTEPIDLFADCLTEKIEVKMVGAYPDTQDMFAGLAAAKDRRRGDLDGYFGQGDLVLE
jgi:hypothetical protein